MLHNVLKCNVTFWYKYKKKGKKKKSYNKYHYNIIQYNTI